MSAFGKNAVKQQVHVSILHKALKRGISRPLKTGYEEKLGRVRTTSRIGETKVLFEKVAVYRN